MFLASHDGLRVYNLNTSHKLECTSHPTRGTWDIQINGEVLASYHEEQRARNEMTYIINAITSDRPYFKVGDHI